MSKIKEWVKSAFEKWAVGIIAGVLMFVGSAVWDYSTRFYELPDRVDTIEKQLNEVDSIMAEYIEWQYQTGQRKQ